MTDARAHDESHERSRAKKVSNGISSTGLVYYIRRVLREPPPPIRLPEQAIYFVADLLAVRGGRHDDVVSDAASLLPVRRRGHLLALSRLTMRVALRVRPAKESV